MSAAFKVGDVVKLKSGGSRMTVSAIDGADVTCIWFEGAKTERDTFPAATLAAYTPPDISISMSR
jgi:uncharacterized protein YodC (DUF2158 family)